MHPACHGRHLAQRPADVCATRRQQRLKVSELRLWAAPAPAALAVDAEFARRAQGELLVLGVAPDRAVDREGGARLPEQYGQVAFRHAPEAELVTQLDRRDVALAEDEHP
jgi:hypothetical protein